MNYPNKTKPNNNNNNFSQNNSKEFELHILKLIENICLSS